jgi:phage shock protein C
MQYESPTLPPRQQRLVRSTRDKMVAGVSGGLAEYFDLDPVVVRLIWIAAGVLTGGLAIPVYGVMWMVMPRQDDFASTGGWRSTAGGPSGDPNVAPEPTASAAEATDPLGVPPTADPSATAAEPSAAGAYASGPSAYGSAPASYSSAYSSAPPAYPPPSYVPEYRRRRQKTAGVVLIAFGLIFLAGQLGIFSWFAWRYFWPVVLIAIGAGLLMRQTSWRR